MDLIEHNKKQEEALRQMRLVLGQNIRAKREALGYSQEKLAFLAGMGAAHLGNIERGSETLEELLEDSCRQEEGERETAEARTR